MTAQPKHVLSVSYDLTLLSTRHLLLEQDGYRVTSTDSFKNAFKQCSHNCFDLLIVGHSIPDGDKKDLIKTFRCYCSAPVLSLRRVGEETVPDADYHAFPDKPEELMQLVKTILAESSSDSASQ